MILVGGPPTLCLPMMSSTLSSGIVYLGVDCLTLFICLTVFILASFTIFDILRFIVFLRFHWCFSFSVALIFNIDYKFILCKSLFSCSFVNTNAKVFAIVAFNLVIYVQIYLGKT